MTEKSSAAVRPKTASATPAPAATPAPTAASAAAASAAAPVRKPAAASARTRYVAHAGITAAVYAAATLLCLFVLQGLAWGPIQFRISEAVCVVAVVSAPAVPGLAIGCVLANLINVAISGTGALGMLDVVFGSLATLLGALWCRKFRSRPKLALFGFVLANAVIVPAYLPILLQGLGYYTIPFTDIALDGIYPLMYVFGLVATGIGESVVIYALGLPLLRGLKKFGVGDDED